MKTVPLPTNPLTKEEAIALFETNWWVGRPAREIASFQLFEDKLCCPFNIFHAAIEEALGRPVFTHEFGLNYEGLCKELGGGEKPSFAEILKLVPKDKAVVVVKVP